MLKKNINKIVVNNEVKGKFEPNWLDTFVIVEAIGLGAYKISSMDGKEEPKTFNSTHLKCFFAKRKWLCTLQHNKNLMQGTCIIVFIFSFSFHYTMFMKLMTCITICTSLTTWILKKKKEKKKRKERDENIIDDIMSREHGHKMLGH